MRWQGLGRVMLILPYKRGVTSALLQKLIILTILALVLGQVPKCHGPRPLHSSADLAPVAFNNEAGRYQARGGVRGGASFGNAWTGPGIKPWAVSSLHAAPTSTFWSQVGSCVCGGGGVTWACMDRLPSGPLEGAVGGKRVSLHSALKVCKQCVDKVKGG
jgi:hypothetical protein